MTAGHNMLNFNCMDEAIQKTGILRDLFFGVRIVDPVAKQVLYSSQPHTLEDPCLPCYNLWENGEICENCISTRSIKEDGIFVKFISQGKELYEVTAVPISIGSQRFALELVQTLNQQLCFDSGEVFDELKSMMRSISWRIDHLLIVDKLTGVYNRRFIDERLPAALISAYSHDHVLSVIFADIDLFKSINDRYGHAAGDRVLQHVAGVLQKNIRCSDGWTARYGGDEFLICLSEVDEADALKIAERLRVSIAANAVDIGANRISITCSFGVQSTGGQGDRLSPQSLIDLADKKLYQAKKAGKNSVV